MAEGPRRWLRIVLPIGGLSIVPLAGLIYAATASVGGSDAKPTSSSLDLLSGSAAPTMPSPARPKPAKPAPPRAANAKACCEKLRGLAQTSEEVDKRATYLAAGAACDAAETDDQAFKQVASICGGDRTEIPAECKP